MVLETKESEKPQESPKFRFSKAKQKICGFGGKVQRKMILGKLNLNVALRKQENCGASMLYLVGSGQGDLIRLVTLQMRSNVRKMSSP